VALIAAPWIFQYSDIAAATAISVVLGSGWSRWRGEPFVPDEPLPLVAGV
jgi:hypothetical protein